MKVKFLKRIKRLLDKVNGCIETVHNCIFNSCDGVGNCRMVEIVVEIAFTMLETVVLIVFQTDEITDQIEFKIPEIKP